MSEPVHINEAAKRLGVELSTVRRDIRRGNLTQAGEAHVTAESLAAQIKRREMLRDISMAMSCQEAAARLAVSPQTVTNMVHAGQLVRASRGFVTTASVEARMSRHGYMSTMTVEYAAEYLSITPDDVAALLKGGELRRTRAGRVCGKSVSRWQKMRDAVKVVKEPEPPKVGHCARCEIVLGCDAFGSEEAGGGVCRDCHGRKRAKLTRKV